MMHPRQEIRAAVAALLTGLPTTGARVFIGRTRKLAANHAPTLLIYTREEAAGTPMDAVSVGRDLRLAVTGKVSAADPPDDLLDDIADEVEGAIRASNNLDRHVFSIDLVQTAIDVRAEGESHVGEITLEYRVRYNHPDEDE